MRIGTLSAMFITVYPGSRIYETKSSCMSLELKVSENGYAVCYKGKQSKKCPNFNNNSGILHNTRNTIIRSNYLEDQLLNIDNLSYEIETTIVTYIDNLN